MVIELLSDKEASLACRLYGQRSQTIGQLISLTVASPLDSIVSFVNAVKLKNVV